jgi:hypothetical protein
MKIELIQAISVLDGQNPPPPPRILGLNQACLKSVAEYVLDA